MAILDTLVEKAKVGDLALLVGTEFREGHAGPPSHRQLARSISGDPEAESLAAVTQQLSPFRYLTNLEQAFTNPNPPGSLHRALVSLPVPYLMTCAYDDHLARALADAGKPFNLLIEDDDLESRKFNRTHLVKLCGDLSRRRSLVIARDDYQSLLDDANRRRLFDEWVGSWLAHKTVLMVGCDPARRSDFFWLFWDVLRKRNAFQQPGYLLWTTPRPADDDAAFWRARNVSLVGRQPTSFLEELAARLAAEPVRLPPDEEMAALKRFVAILGVTRSAGAEEVTRPPQPPPSQRLRSIRATLGLRLKEAEEDGSERLQARLDLTFDPDFDAYAGEFCDTDLTLAELTAWADEAALLRERSEPPENSEVETQGLAFFDRLLDAPAGQKQDAGTRRRLAQAVYLRQAFADAMAIVFDLHDQRLAAIPWELLHAGNLRWEDRVVGRGFLGLEFPVYRRLTYASTRLVPVARLQRALLVAADPDGDLPGLPSELQSIRESLIGAGLRPKDITVVPPDSDMLADKEAVKALIRDGAYDLLHFAGHGSYTDVDPKESRLWLGRHDLDDEVFLRADELAQVAQDSRLTFVFMSSCQGGAEAGSPGIMGGRKPWEAAGLVHALVGNGLPAAAGMRWDVGSANSRLLAGRFYEELMKGNALERSLLLARQAVNGQNRSEDRADWPNPVLVKRHGILG